VFATVSDVKRSRQTSQTDTRRYVIDPKVGGGLTALRVADGGQVWHVAAKPCPEDAPSGCSPSQPGAVTGIPGVVFTTSNDGHIRAHSTETGELLWEFNTMRDFHAVNGVKASGGSMDGILAMVVFRATCCWHSRRSNRVICARNAPNVLRGPTHNTFASSAARSSQIYC
jgi:hypothetical protein